MDLSKILANEFVGEAIEDDDQIFVKMNSGACIHRPFDEPEHSFSAISVEEALIILDKYAGPCNCHQCRRDGWLEYNGF